MPRRKFQFHDGVSGAALNVKVVPRASHNEIAGMHSDGVLKVRVTAAPAGGAANEAIIRLLAKELDLKTSSIEIVAGRTSTQKLISIIGLSPKEVDERLGLETGARPRKAG